MNVRKVFLNMKYDTILCSLVFILFPRIQNLDSVARLPALETVTIQT